MRYTLKRDDIPLLSQWIKKDQVFRLGLFWLPLLGSNQTTSVWLCQTLRLSRPEGGKVAMCANKLRQDGVTPQSQEEEPKRKPEAFASGLLFGSPCWARTNDIMINSHALYRLS